MGLCTDLFAFGSSGPRQLTRDAHPAREEICRCDEPAPAPGFNPDEPVAPELASRMDSRSLLINNKVGVGSRQIGGEEKENSQGPGDLSAPGKAGFGSEAPSWPGLGSEGVGVGGPGPTRPSGPPYRGSAGSRA